MGRSSRKGGSSAAPSRYGADRDAQIGSLSADGNQGEITVLSPGDGSLFSSKIEIIDELSEKDLDSVYSQIVERCQQELKEKGVLPNELRLKVSDKHVCARLGAMELLEDNPASAIERLRETPGGGNLLQGLLEDKLGKGERFSERDWLDFQSLRKGVEIASLPDTFRPLLQELPTSTRGLSLEWLARNGESDLIKEVLALEEKDLREEATLLAREVLNSPFEQGGEPSDSERVLADGTKVFLDKDGRLHNPDGPAVIFKDGTEGFYVDGKEIAQAMPCRIYPDGTLEYLDNYEPEMQSNLYKAILPDKTVEWRDARGIRIRKIKEDGEEVIFPDGTKDIALGAEVNPYRWAGERFHASPEAYKNEKNVFLSSSGDLDSQENKLFNKIQINELNRRHPADFQMIESDKLKKFKFAENLLEDNQVWSQKIKDKR